ncbi:DNA mismatch repair protein [Halococcus morrhuae DSM 1307]|uniref:DNA-binding protein MutS2 n=1 Tax=Halococcus morrhuae DSM 1307 TaxID=931277 RepID=M0MTU9_HALMO|nr:helix-hairpin-helix domain-containing protein [Halococcus morrhuae]EMA48768.1 DNA mismatch repair protein [Halococcus morrhuae DSM 1307]
MDSFEDLTAISGVGEKTAARLQSIEEPERALREGDVAALARAPEITPGRAAAIARAAIRAEHDDSGTFLATDRAREIHRAVLDLLQERAVTDDAAHRLETLFPTGSASRIEEVREWVERAMEREPDPETLDALVGVGPLESPPAERIRERCLATADAERHAEAQEAFPELSVEVVEDTRGLADLARGYATVIVLDEAFAGVDIDGDVRVMPDALDSPEEVVPERTLAFFAHNRERIRAASAVHRAAELDSSLDLAALDDRLAELDDDGTVIGDEELDRLERAVDDLDATVSTAESVANDRLREAIEERDVTIEGADLLSLVEQGAGVDSLLSRELEDEHAAAIEAARDHLVDALALDSSEAELATRAFPEEPTFPVEHDEGIVNRLREDLTVARDRRASRLKRDLAADLAGMREGCDELVRAALARDVELAVSRFARDFDCVLPEFGDSGIAIEGGCSPLLDCAFAEVEPIDYEVSGPTLLSGVNSGGKTSTLDLLALVTVLSHMGLPVPADSVRIERYEALHYQEKSQGTLDAGAFEATLREFAGLVAGGTHRLVLVDELESITEPGASATIIAGILEELAGSTTGVFVSHLAGEISEAADFSVSIDGIEAVGLENGELVVERSPKKDVLARSTPELIVEKLATESDDDTDGFYEKLLGKFE